MKKSMFKFVLLATALQGVTMPKGSEILHAEEQGEEICLWALCPQTTETEKRRIAVLPTGTTDVPEEVGANIDAAHFIGTVLIRTKGLVFHLFDVTA